MNPENAEPGRLSEPHDEVPQVYALKRQGGGWALSRRDFLTAGATI